MIQKQVREMYEMQRLIDEKIMKTKGLEGQDLFEERILALQVEVAELCNSWREFKYWSNDRNPRMKEVLEEYVDALHFILSIGLYLGLEEEMSKRWNFVGVKDEKVKAVDFTELLYQIGNLAWSPSIWSYGLVVFTFNMIGYSLGFTWDQIVEAYMEKNRENHRRQAAGY